MTPTHDPSTHTTTPVAIVTGGSEGLGRALTLALVRRGWHVVTDGRRPEPLHRVAAAVDDLRGSLTTVVGDVADPDHRSRLVIAAGEAGTLQLLVNNASTLGRSPMPSLDHLDSDDLTRVLDVNLVAPLALARLALSRLGGDRPTVVNVTSDASIEPYPGWGAYGASKAALDHASRILAAEQPDVRVYAVDPGDMRTQLHQLAFPGEDISDRPEPETVVPALLRLLDGDLPSGRWRLSDLAGDADDAHDTDAAVTAGAHR